MSKVDRYLRRAPKVYKPGINPVITALLTTLGDMDDTAQTQLVNTKSQIFIKSADGKYLTRLASGVGVSNPADLPMLDDTFRELIPNISLKAKQVRNTFYDICDVFWGPLFTRVNINTTTAEPFNVTTGEKIIIKVDGGVAQTIRARTGDIASDGAATAVEVAAILNRIEGVTASVIDEQVSGNKTLNIRTNTVGPTGSLEITATGSTMIDAAKLDFVVNQRIRITNLNQRAVIYELRNKELLIELPAVVPILFNTLKGSHHFHADATIEPPAGPNNSVWSGGFFFNPTAGNNPFEITGQKTTILEVISKGGVFTKVTVADGSQIPDAPGFLVFNFGRTNQEVPVKYLGRPNNNTILLDPGHQFGQTHLLGSNINVIDSALKAYVPKTNGDDLAMYFVSPARARAVVQELLESIAAAGVIVNFQILLPDFKYLCDNPYE